MVAIEDAAPVTPERLLGLWQYGRVPAHAEPAAVTAAADRHGIAVLLFDRLTHAGSDGTEPVSAALRPLAAAAVAREAFCRLELARVLRALAEAGVRALVFKGSALAYSTYADAALRPRTDTDLLIDPRELPQATSALELLGYRRTELLTSGTFVSSQLAFERNDERGVTHVLDVHWKVVNPHAIAGAFAFESLWDAAVPAERLSEHARIPCSVHACVLACTHRLAHHQHDDRLVWLYDIHLLAGAFDRGMWAQFVDAARAWGVASLCADGLLTTASAFGTRVPPEALRALLTAGRAEPSRAYVERRVVRRRVLLDDLRALRGWRQRARLLWEHAFPPASFIKARYQVRTGALLPALYAHRLITGAYRWIRA